MDFLKFITAPFRQAANGLKQEEALLGNAIYTEVRWQADREAVEVCLARMMTLKPAAQPALQKALEAFRAACT